LRQIAAHLTQQGQRRGILHAFRDHLHSQAMRHFDSRPHDGHVGGLVPQFAHEHLVDL